MREYTRLVAAGWLGLVAVAAAAAPARPDTKSEQADIAAFRAARERSLASETGWLTLVGLFWLKPGANSFGRAGSNALVLDNAALPAEAGSFVVDGAAARVRFIARPGSGITHDGAPVEALELTADTQSEPTVLASGSLRFYLIERAGNLGVRVRDLNNPRRLSFHGLEYFPVRDDWVIEARFQPYQPVHHLKIVNILGMEEELECPGALVFRKAGREWRLDAVLESPEDKELFIMFADATSGHETYGAGRFLYVPLPAANSVRVDFNKAVNPPCGLNDFATCPLPPSQNRLRLRVEAGEKSYAGAPHHGA